MPRGRPLVKVQIQEPEDDFIQNKRCYVYDFRLSADGVDRQKLIKLLFELAKKWIFQLEQGQQNGYKHYQGRLSLIKKQTKFGLLSLIQDPIYKFQYLMPTITKEAEDYQTTSEAFYQMKLETRIDGPWSDKTEKLNENIPPIYRISTDKLRPFQLHIYNSTPEQRTINIIYCPDGFKGKSFIAEYCFFHKDGVIIPNISDSKEIMQMAYCVCSDRGIRYPKIFIDLPRASKLQKEFFVACEMLKGHVYYDCRNRYKYYTIYESDVWVFTNQIPPMSYLSRDRWKIWTINDKYELIESMNLRSLSPPDTNKNLIYEYFDYLESATPSTHSKDSNSDQAQNSEKE